MPGLTRIRTALLALLLAAVVSAAAMTPIFGGGEQEERTLPTISISATDGATTVEEGQDASFTVTANPAPTEATEVLVRVLTTGEFTEIPNPSRVTRPLGPNELTRIPLTPRTTQAEFVIPTDDDALDEENGTVEAHLIAQTSYLTGVNKWEFIHVQDNDPTVAPQKMAPPTVLPTDGGMEVLWEEPAHTGDTRITGYSITWASTGDSGSTTIQGDQRHHSIRGRTNGTSYVVRIQACKGLHCGENSDAVTATPTDSGPAITGPQTASLPEEAGGTVGQYSATPSGGATITWRLGGEDSEYFNHTVNPDGNITLSLKAGTSFEPTQDRNRDNAFQYQVAVVATDDTPSMASNATHVTVEVTDVDETPAFSQNSLVRPTYVVGQPIQGFLLPAPKADEGPITYVTTGLPPGLSRPGARPIIGTPTQAGSFVATHTATDGDGDSGSLNIEFTVVLTANNAPTVVATLDEYHLDKDGGTEEIDLGGLFDDEDGDTLAGLCAKFRERRGTG